MPVRGRVRRRPPALGDRQGEQGPAPGAGLILSRRRRVERVTLVTRDGCHLCALAEPVVARAAADAGAALEVLDVDADHGDGGALHRAHTDRVPVVLLDGVEHCYWQVDERALRRALRL